MHPNGFAVQPVRVPQELLNAHATKLEEYVRARLNQFALTFAQKVAPNMHPEIVQRVIGETYTQLPPPEYGSIPIEEREFQLLFRHDCLALGCTDPQCALCQHNPHRRCRINFDKKYLVGDPLKAKCTAVIRVELVERATGQLYEEDIPGVEFELSILDGNQYDQRILDKRLSTEDELRELEYCVLLLNNKNQPLLVSGSNALNAPEGKVVAQLNRGRMNLPELQVTDSSEALLSGRKPPFRLLVSAVDKERRGLRIRNAVSEPFVVATRRTRTAGKLEIPSIEDQVCKLEHMGKETVKKLTDLSLAAVAAKVTLPKEIPNRIEKVGQFKWLAQNAEQDGTLRQKLQQVLKLSKEKWDEARDHAMKAVVPDNRMRAWYSEKHKHQIGLLFTCRMGKVNMDNTVALLQSHGRDQGTIQATTMADLTPQQREQVRTLQEQAFQAWCQTAHPGWTLCPYDSEQYRETGCIARVSALPDVPHVLNVSGGSQTLGDQHRQAPRDPSPPQTFAPVSSPLPPRRSYNPRPQQPPARIQAPPRPVHAFYASASQANPHLNHHQHQHQHQHQHPHYGQDPQMVQDPQVIHDPQVVRDPQVLQDPQVMQDPQILPAATQPLHPSHFDPSVPVEEAPPPTAFSMGPPVPPPDQGVPTYVVNAPLIPSYELDGFMQQSMEAPVEPMNQSVYGPAQSVGKVESLELSEDPFSQRQRPCARDLGRASTGLDSMQSIEASLDEVEKEKGWNIDDDVGQTSRMR